MALPKIDLPLFELTIPSSGKTVNYRPFTVKEEKILLIAQESKDIEQIVIAIKQIIDNCVQDVNVEKMPMFDLEYIMLNLRAKSVNNEISFTVKDPDTNEVVKLGFDINSIDVTRNDDHKIKIDVSDDYFIMMRYPTLNEFKMLSGVTDAKNKAESLLNVMLACIDILSSTDGDKIYKLDEFTQEEVKDFIESLSGSAIKQIQKFFETIPTIKITIPYTRKDGTEKTFVLEGTESFFI